MNAAIDKKQVRRAFSRHCGDNDIFAIIAERLTSRVDELPIQSKRIADIGGNGEHLATRFPDSQITAINFALPAVRGDSPNIFRIQGDAEKLPLADASVDIAWSNLCLSWTDIKTALAEAARILRPKSGLLIFSILGRDTLHEARTILGDNRVHTFWDMHDIGDMLGRAGFLEPVLETEHISLSYASAAAAMREARSYGGGNALATRPRTLMGKTKWQDALANYEHQFTDESGRTSVTLEIIYIVSWRKAAGEEYAQEKIIRFTER